MNLQITNGRIIDPANNTDRIMDLFIIDGKIASLGTSPAGFIAERTLDASNQIVIPGLVDLAARLREPGQEHKTTIASETRAAAAAGITTLCCPPDTQPVIDSPAEIKFIQQRAEKAGFCHVYSLGALTADLRGERLSEMAALKKGGCVGVSNALHPMGSTLILRRAMEYAASQGLTVFLHPIDHALSNHGCAHEGRIATRLGLPAIPAAAETAALGQQLALVELCGVRTHFCRLSTEQAAKMVARARAEGLPVSADICAHQLFLTEMDIGDFNSLCHTMPPLRTHNDLEGLRSSLDNEVLHAICSDHQPHELEAKRAPFPETEPGISALETLLPLTLRLVEQEDLELSEAIALVTYKPASVLQLDAGTLSIGCPADVCIYDPEFSWEFKAENLLSRGKNTPFDGWHFRGRVSHTLLDGRVVYDANPG
ncbi:MAG: dihydroorotase [Pseudomonadota bacterium]